MLNKIITVMLALALVVVLAPKKAKDFSALEEGKSQQVLGTSTEAGRSSLSPSPELALQTPPPDLTAKSALAFDLNSGSILFTKNFDEKLPIASLTKLMTAIVVVKNIDLNAEVVVRKADIEVIGTNMGLLPGEKIKVIDLLHAMLISSSNDAALALASGVAGSHSEFVFLMNQEANRLGLANTNFTNPVGLDHVDNYSTTNDLLKIVQKFLEYPPLTEIVEKKEATVYSVDKKYVHKLRSTNKLLLEDPKIVGIKTGFTSAAQGNLIIRAKHNGQDVATVVLGSSNREDDSRRLLDWLFAVYKW